MDEDTVMKVQIHNGVLSFNSALSPWGTHEKGDSFMSVESVIPWLKPNSDSIRNQPRSHVTEVSTAETTLSALLVESTQERMRKEFEESLEENNLEKLPSIEVLQIIETTVSPTTQPPVISQATIPVTSRLIVPVTVRPTSQPTASATYRPTVPVTPRPATHLKVPITQPTEHVTPHTKQSTSLFVTIPSPWKPVDKRFKGVIIRRFNGEHEVDYSPFDKSISFESQ